MDRRRPERGDPCVRPDPISRTCLRRASRTSRRTPDGKRRPRAISDRQPRLEGCRGVHAGDAHGGRAETHAAERRRAFTGADRSIRSRQRRRTYFILNHYTVDGDELLLVEHLSGEKKGTISGDPINTGAEKASNNDSRDSASPSKLESAEKNPENFVESNDWTDWIVGYDRYDKEETYEVCESDDDYGVHLYSGFTVNLTKGTSKIGDAALGAIVEYLLDPLGIPGLATVVTTIVGYIAERNFTQMTWILLDSDGALGVRNVNIRYNNIYNADYDNTSYRGSVPGHLD